MLARTYADSSFSFLELDFRIRHWYGPGRCVFILVTRANIFPVKIAPIGIANLGRKFYIIFAIMCFIQLPVGTWAVELCWLICSGPCQCGCSTPKQTAFL